jgi:hypothetical protein
MRYLVHEQEGNALHDSVLERKAHEVRNLTCSCEAQTKLK